jgi:hypothetical protein
MNHRGLNSRKYTRRYFVQAGLRAGVAALPADAPRNLLSNSPKLRSSSILRSVQRRVRARRLLSGSRRIPGYVKPFGTDQFTFGPARPQVDYEKIPIANTVVIAKQNRSYLF